MRDLKSIKYLIAVAILVFAMQAAVLAQDESLVSIEAKQPENKPVVVTEDKEGKVAEVEERAVTGTITVIKPNLITLRYHTDTKKAIARDISFKISENIQLAHKRSLSDLRIGDTVTVAYDSIVREKREKRSGAGESTTKKSGKLKIKEGGEEAGGAGETEEEKIIKRRVRTRSAKSISFVKPAQNPDLNLGAFGEEKPMPDVYLSLFQALGVEDAVAMIFYKSHQKENELPELKKKLEAELIRKGQIEASGGTYELPTLEKLSSEKRYQ